MSATIYQAKSLFHVGHYERVVEIFKTNTDTSDNGLYYMYLRSLLALRKYEKVIEELDAMSPGSEFSALRICAQARGENASDDLQKFLSDPNRVANPRVISIAAEHFLSFGLLDECVKLAGPRMAAEDVEAAWLLAQVYAKLNRADLCLRVHETLNKWEEPLPVLIQLCEATAELIRGTTTSIHEAVYALEELVQTFAASTFLLTSLGTCHLALGQKEDALQYLSEAVEMGKNPDAIANYSVALALAGRDNSSHLELLQKEFPSHPLSAAIAEKKATFDRLVESSKGKH